MLALEAAPSSPRSGRHNNSPQRELWVRNRKNAQAPEERHIFIINAGFEKA